LPWQAIIPEWCVSNYRNAWTVKEYCSLFIGAGHSSWRITIMPLIKVYNNDSDHWRLKGHFIFKSVRSFVFGYAVVPKLRERYLRHHVQAASAEAVSFCRTFGDEAWSQQYLWSYLFLLVQMRISYSSCAKAKTNVLPRVFLCLVLDWKGNGV
jgi:Na+/melibiose symporter-like transporter